MKSGKLISTFPSSNDSHKGVRQYVKEAYSLAGKYNFYYNLSKALLGKRHYFKRSAVFIQISGLSHFVNPDW